MQTQIQPYLFFGGRCEEALNFYQQALGAKIGMMMRFDENPEPPPAGALPPGFEKRIMHAELRVGDTAILASDGDSSESNFDGFRMALTLATEAETQRSFNALAVGGSIQMPPAKTFFSPCFGMLTDRFGIGWMVMARPSA